MHSVYTQDVEIQFSVAKKYRLLIGFFSAWILSVSTGDRSWILAFFNSTTYHAQTQAGYSYCKLHRATRTLRLNDYYSVSPCKAKPAHGICTRGLLFIRQVTYRPV